MPAAGGSRKSPEGPSLGLRLSEPTALGIWARAVALHSGHNLFCIMMHLPRPCSRLASNKPHAGGCSAQGNNRSSWLPQAIVRIIKTHESEMAACNKSFTSSCFVHFLNNRTFPPSLPLPPAPLCLGSIISQMHSSKAPGSHKWREGGRPETAES